MTTPLPHNTDWNFPESERDTKICPKCGEASPQDAVMCWACYMPLAGKKSVSDLKFQKQARALLRAEKRKQKLSGWSHAFFSSLTICGVLLLILSGYVPKYRAFLMATGMAYFVVSFVWGKYQQARHERQLVEEGKPIERIANTILYYALRDGAGAITLRAGVMGIECEYLIGDEWKEQMHIPPYIWEPLRDHLAGRGDNWQRPFSFQEEEVRGTVTPRLEHLFPHQTIVLRLESLA